MGDKLTVGRAVFMPTFAEKAGVAEERAMAEMRKHQIAAMTGEALALKASVATLTAERDALRAKVEALQDRLEMRHAFDGSGKRISVEPGSIPDGIECRDATISGQRGIIEELRAENARLREAAVSARKIIAEIDAYQKDPERGEFGVECACCMGELLDDDRETLASIDAALAKSTGSPDGQQ